jgi:hypothetical protein
MSSADSHLLTSRRMISAGILLALSLALGIAVLFQQPEPVSPEKSSPAPPPAAASSKPEPRASAADIERPVAAGAPSVSSAGSPELVAAVLPGHEGHGDECAQCLAERKLAVYREDFAQLHFTQASEGRAPTPEQAAELLDACRLFSKSALREWSFSEAKPRLTDDSTLEKLRSEMLQPLIERLPKAADEAP